MESSEDDFPFQLGDFWVHVNFQGRKCWMLKVIPLIPCVSLPMDKNETGRTVNHYNMNDNKHEKK